MNTPLAFAAALAVSFAATGANAQQSPRAEVHYNDLDLTTEEGLDTLDRRIAQAGRDVCGPYNPPADELIRYRRCLVFARNSVKKQRHIAIANAQTRKARLASVIRSR